MVSLTLSMQFSAEILMMSCLLEFTKLLVVATLLQKKSCNLKPPEQQQVHSQMAKLSKAGIVCCKRQNILTISKLGMIKIWYVWAMTSPGSDLQKMEYKKMKSKVNFFVPL